MSVPDGSAMPGSGFDQYLRDELTTHRAKVFEALSRHSDPGFRAIGHQLASGTVAPHQLLGVPQYVDVLRRGVEGLAALSTEELHRQVFGGQPSRNRTGDDPDDREGGVPAVRR